MARLALTLVLLLGACSPSVADVTPETSSTTTVTTTTITTTTTTTAPSTSPLSAQVAPVGSALFDPAALPAPSSPPVSVTIDGIPVSDAPVIGVGVEDNGELEIPGAREVGWYRFGPTPRDEGSAVLAAHIAFNGRDGVFRRLASVDLGAVVTVTYEDGTQSSHVVTEIAQYSKEGLPFDRVFAKTGPSTLTLITCGGTFNPSLKSYEDNIVVYAQPLETTG